MNLAEAAPLQDQDGLIWYVDIEHESAVRDAKRAPDFDRVREQRTRVVGEAAALHAESIFFWEVSQELAKQKHIKAIVLSGNTTDWMHYDFVRFEPLCSLVKSGSMPTLGLCGGHQLLGLIYGAACEAMRKLRPGEADPAEWAPGFYKEVGYMPVQILTPDPLFDGLVSDPVFFESHYWEIKDLPPEFTMLASAADARVQCMKHQRFPIYGTQFHPEVNDVDHPDGMRLLRNFFKAAGVSHR